MEKGEKKNRKQRQRREEDMIFGSGGTEVRFLAVGVTEVKVEILQLRNI